MRGFSANQQMPHAYRSFNRRVDLLRILEQNV
jgi:hypothetical protein